MSAPRIAGCALLASLGGALDAGGGGGAGRGVGVESLGPWGLEVHPMPCRLRREELVTIGVLAEHGGANTVIASQLGMTDGRKN